MAQSHYKVLGIYQNNTPIQGFDLSKQPIVFSKISLLHNFVQDKLEPKQFFKDDSYTMERYILLQPCIIQSSPGAKALYLNQ